MNRAFRYRIYPTAEQAAAMERTVGVCRFLWNLALEQRRDFWRQAKARGVRFNFVSQGREVTVLRRECAWLAAAPLTPLTQVLRHLDRAFAAFFAGRAEFPSFRSRHSSRASFTHQGHDVRFVELNDKWALIRVPKVGMVRMRLTRPWRGRIVSATFSRDALGWHVSLGCEIEHEAAPSTLPAVGIDRGIANTIALSTGELLSTPDASALERRRKRAQRVLARRQRGSARYRKQRQRVASIAAKIARVRAHWRHETTTGLARKFGFVGMEDLNTAAMMRTGKRGLSRGIAEQGWAAFATALNYKLQERGGALVNINPAYTSQECSDCGVIDKQSRESQSRFACRSCGFADHADVNAAKNILRRSTARVEATVCRADEALTLAEVGVRC